MNTITISGRINTEPKQISDANGTARTVFSVAVNRFAKKDETPITDYFDCFAFGKLGEAILNDATLDDVILIAGRMLSSRDTDNPSVIRWEVNVQDFSITKANGK